MAALFKKQKSITLKASKNAEQIDLAKQLIVYAHDYIELAKAEKRIQDTETKEFVAKQILVVMDKINETTKGL